VEDLIFKVTKNIVVVILGSTTKAVKNAHKVLQFTASKKQTPLQAR